MRAVSLYRYRQGDQGTRGIGITDTRKHFCVLELPWRDNQSDRSCIPDGEYLCKFRISRKFGECYHLQDVEGRTWILTHSGNLAGDVAKGWKAHSHGCLLFGAKFGKLAVAGRYQDAVLSSKPTIRKFNREMARQDFIMRITTVDAGLEWPAAA